MPRKALTHHNSLHFTELPSRASLNPSQTIVIDTSMNEGTQLGKLRTQRILKNLNLTEFQIKNQLSRSNAMRLMRQNKTSVKHLPQDLLNQN